MNTGSQTTYNKAKTKYELNSKKCKQCNKIISYDTFRKDRKRKFCSRSCAATFNNKGRIKSKKAKEYKKFPFCLFCNELILIINWRYKRYCSRQCQTDFEYNQYINRWKQGLERGWIGKTKTLANPIRKYIFEKYNSRCAECSENRVNPYSNKSILQIDHKDGNCENNKEENLILLCPTCHAMTSTYGALNKGNSKRYYKTNGEIKNSQK